MKATRRHFLKQAGLAAVAVPCGLPLLEASRRAAQHAPAEALAAKTRWALVIDLEQCAREEVRTACIEACHREHNVPVLPDPAEEVKWIWTEPLAAALPDQAHARTSAERRQAPVLVLCNHCDDPPCVRVCPTGATWKREDDGVVMMDMHRCVGCRYCMAACPYGARSFNWRDPLPYIPTGEDGALLSAYPPRARGVAEKCTFCAERLREGRPPACVEAAAAVPGASTALVFGDQTDPTSEVSRILRDESTVCRRVSLGTGPNVYYRTTTAAPQATEVSV